MESESSSTSEIDESINQQILDYLNSLDEDPTAPENESNPDQISFEEILRQDYLEQTKMLENVTYKDGWRDLFDTVDSTRTSLNGFYSIGSDIYYTDPITGLPYCNTTISYEHIMFTFDSDCKVVSIVPQSGYENNRRVKLLLEAFSHIGAPYNLNANPPSSFACGRFVEYVYLVSLGVRQRWSSFQQIIDDFYTGSCASNNANLSMQPESFTSLSDLLPGDLIYWMCPNCHGGNNCPIMNNCPSTNGVHHTAIYIGNGQVIEAVDNNTTHCVVVGDIRQMNGLTIFDDMYNGDHIMGYVRLINEAPTLPAVTGFSAKSAGRNKVIPEWNSNLYSDGYLVYARKNGVYGYCGMTTIKTYDAVASCFKSSILDLTALISENDYYVFPYGTDYAGVMHVGNVSVKAIGKGICPAVSNLELTALPGAIQLRWSPSTDAEGYLFYGYIEGESYGYIGMTTITDGDYISFIDYSASSVAMNHYVIFPYFVESNNQVIPGVVSNQVNGLAL